MTQESILDDASKFRRQLVLETAKCVANRQLLPSANPSQGWDGLGAQQQENLTENIARIFSAIDEAMHSLTDPSKPRGLV